MTDYKEDTTKQAIHALTMARDHLCFLNGWHNNDTQCPLTQEEINKLENCIGDIIDIRKEVIYRGNDD